MPVAVMDRTRLHTHSPRHTPTEHLDADGLASLAGVCARLVCLLEQGQPWLFALLPQIER